MVPGGFFTSSCAEIRTCCSTLLHSLTSSKVDEILGRLRAKKAGQAEWVGEVEWVEWVESMSCIKALKTSFSSTKTLRSFNTESLTKVLFLMRVRDSSWQFYSGTCFDDDQPGGEARLQTCEYEKAFNCRHRGFTLSYNVFLTKNWGPKASWRSTTHNFLLKSWASNTSTNKTILKRTLMGKVIRRMKSAWLLEDLPFLQGSWLLWDLWDSHTFIYVWEGQIMLTVFKC